MKDCLTCRYAWWSYTNRTPPRINLNKTGECWYKVDVRALPIPESRRERDLDYILASKRNPTIHPKQPHTDCNVWEEKP